MPRHYKPKPGGKRSRSYTTENLVAAVDAVRKGLLSQRQASQDFGIPRGTLQNKLSGSHTGRYGGQSVFNEEEEIIFRNYLSILGQWGFPLSIQDFRFLVKSYLDRCGRTERRFSGNIPSNDWVKSFIKRHKSDIAIRFCQNIKTARAKVSRESISQYFDNLEDSLNGIPNSNILNYDETNLSDDPGKQRCIFKRGSKYPERIMNSTKSSTSLMFSATASGELLPLYVVYKATHLMNTWTEGGPNNTRYNRSKSGWFDNVCFGDWFSSIVLPWAQKRSGKKVIIGDNLSSHFSTDVLKLCKQHDIKFVCLPANSTHLCQPLDVSVFSSLKHTWRTLLSKWKEGPGRKLPTLPKDKFPQLLKDLLQNNTNMSSNIISGFKKTGICPLNREEVLCRLPEKPGTNLTSEESRNVFTELFFDSLKEMRFQENSTSVKRKRVSVEPGKSISFEDIDASTSLSEKSRETGILNSEKENFEADSVDEISSNTSGSSYQEYESTSEFDIDVNKWVIVKYSTKNRSIHYIGKVLEIIEEENSEKLYEISFLRRSTKIANSFVPPNQEDIDLLSAKDIIRVLPSPKISKRNHYNFGLNFDGLNIQ